MELCKCNAFRNFLFKEEDCFCTLQIFSNLNAAWSNAVWDTQFLKSKWNWSSNIFLNACWIFSYSSKSQWDQGGRRILLGGDRQWSSCASASQVPVHCISDFKWTSLSIRVYLTIYILKSDLPKIWLVPDLPERSCYVSRRLSVLDRVNILEMEIWFLSSTSSRSVSQAVCMTSVSMLAFWLHSTLSIHILDNWTILFPSVKVYVILFIFCENLLTMTLKP